jgi:hypothetical protein
MGKKFKQLKSKEDVSELMREREDRDPDFEKMERPKLADLIGKPRVELIIEQQLADAAKRHNEDRDE